jgi:hypothetical protein
MLSNPKHDDRLGQLHTDIERAPAVTPALMADVVAHACARMAAPGCAQEAARIRRLIEIEAWADATLALIALELPQWQVRRLVYEDGEYWCYLSKNCPLPDWLDDCAVAGHAILPLAMLSAFVEALRNKMAARAPAATTPRIRRERRPDPHAVCCDNFS